MDITTLKRDAKIVHGALTRVGDSLVATRGVKIYIPGRFPERNLAEISSETNIVGIFGIVVDDKYYGVCKAIARMRIEPTSTNVVKIQEDDYYEFYFEPGSVVVPDVQLPVDDTLAYYVYDEFVAKGRIPWYMSQNDLATLYDNSNHHAGVTVGANHAIMEMIIASISRTETDKTKYYRHAIQRLDEMQTNPPAYIPFKSVIYGATNTTARLMGSYFNDGLVSALTNPSQRLERIEELLRR